MVMGADEIISFSFCGKRARQTVREKDQALLLSSPEGGQGSQNPSDSFTYLKNFLNFHSIIGWQIRGSFQECIQVLPQKGLILRGQRIHVRGGIWAVSSPWPAYDFFQGHPWTVPSSSPCPGYAPKGHRHRGERIP